MIVAVIGIVGADDIPSITRGAPGLVRAGSTLLVVAVVMTSVAALFAGARLWLMLGAYVALMAGLGSYALAAVHVTGDPTAPIITMTTDESEQTTVDVAVRGLAFNERLHVRATFADRPEGSFERVLVGPEEDGTAAYRIVVPAQDRARRLQVTAHVLRAESVPRAVECNDGDAERTCAEAALRIPRGIPDVRARRVPGGVRVRVQDRGRVPGVVALGVRSAGRLLYAAHSRIDDRRFRVRVPLGRHRGRTVCVAAVYGRAVPRCTTHGAATVRLGRLPR
ncbi:MAG TPA: hypothetical protein VFR97_02805 [Capillimicrobium sp.]|nr:hypothetical protein [Capillimicrobium sp.]